MTLPASGQLALSQVEVELLGSSPSQLNVDNQSFRLLASLGNNDAVLPSGSQIKWSDLYGKGVKRVSNTGTAENYNLYTNASGAGYSAGLTLVIFNNSGTLGATTISNYALTVPAAPSGFTSGDKVQVVNTGYIIGKGGAGATGGAAVAQAFYGCGFDIVFGGSSGGSGGPAIRVTYSATYIDNTGGTIGGGGSGGSSGGGAVISGSSFGGGGGGGGAGYNSSGGGGGAESATTQVGGFCQTGPTGQGPNGSAGTLLAPGNGGVEIQHQSGSNGGNLGNGGALVGLANVNSGAGITNGTIYGAQT